MTDSTTPTTTEDRAREINSMIVGAWMVREGLSEQPLPDLSSVTLSECIEASRFVAAAPGRRNPDGSTTMTCFVDPTRIPALYAWTLATTASGPYLSGALA